MKRVKLALVGRLRVVTSTASFAGLPRGGAVPFDEVLRHAIGLAQTVDGGEPEAAATARFQRARSPAAAVDRTRWWGEVLRFALEDLGEEALAKLLELARAGREGRALGAADEAVLAASDQSTVERLLADAPRLAEYLQRGQAVAYATEFDLDLPLGSWKDVAPQGLMERAWQSFGKQLAQSQPAEWSCFGVVDDGRRRRLTRLYLRLADRAWWSFRRGLDRPSPAFVEERRARAGAFVLAGTSMQTLADARCFTQGRALRRALRAIRARLGALTD